MNRAVLRQNALSILGDRFSVLKEAFSLLLPKMPNSMGQSFRLKKKGLNMKFRS